MDAAWQRQKVDLHAFTRTEGSVQGAVLDQEGSSSGSSDSDIPDVRAVDPGPSVADPRERARQIWDSYARYHLNKPVPAIIQDGRFQPRNALRFQRRVESLVRAKK